MTSKVKEKMLKDVNFQTKLKNKATWRQHAWNPVKYKDSDS